MELKPGYKRTEVGVIPEEWNLELLGSVGTWLSGGTPSKSNESYWTGDIPWVSPKDMKVSRLRDSIDHVSESALGNGTRLAPRGAILMVVRGMILAHSFPVAYVDRPLAFNQDIKALVARPGIESEFVLRWLQANESHLLSLTSEATHGTKRMPSETLFAMKYGCPPLPEQRAIARALGDVDALIDVLGQLIAKARDLKQAAMQELLRSKDGWVNKKLGEVASFHKGKGLAKSELDPFGAEPCIHYGELFTKYPESIAQVQSRTDSKNGAFRSIANDVLMPTSDVTPNGLATASCVLQDEVILGGDILVIRAPQNQLNGSFLSYVIRWSRDQIMQLVTGTTVYHLYGSDMKKFTFSIPNIKEQKTIVKILDDMDAELAALEQRRDKTRAIKQGMMQELLTGRTRLVSSEAASLPQKEKRAVAKPFSHNWAINEAVVISVLSKQFGTEKFPLGRKRYTKLAYLLHRHVEKEPEGYLKKAAGPYNPSTKYKGPERIAQRNGYVRTHASGRYSGFVAADNIGKAEEYFQRWYGPAVLQWLEQFRFSTNDELELLATVDMAVRDLQNSREDVSLQRVKDVIRRDPEWEAKLTRPVFADANITAAMKTCEELFD